LRPVASDARSIVNVSATASCWISVKLSNLVEGCSLRVEGVL